MSASPVIDVPRHVAIIMDGNGRWAQRRCLPRAEGHRRGARTVRRIVTHCRKSGVEALTLYAFSSENWGRPQGEVDQLMELLKEFLRNETPTLLENGISLEAIGDIARLPEGVRLALTEVRRLTAHGRGMRLNLALSYGGRDELVRAIRQLVDQARLGSLAPDAVCEQLVASHLDTRGLPDPDLLIRTGGEHRLSNFLLWQSAYSELYLTDVPWPEFGTAHLDAALRWYAGRKRRFGLTDQQLAGASEQGYKLEDGPFAVIP